MELFGYSQTRLLSPSALLLGQYELASPHILYLFYNELFKASNNQWAHQNESCLIQHLLVAGAFSFKKSKAQVCWINGPCFEIVLKLGYGSFSKSMVKVGLNLKSK